MALSVMNSISRNIFKAVSATGCGNKVRIFTKPLTVVLQDQQYTRGLTRSLWLLCSGKNPSHKLVKDEWSTMCGCGCSTVGALHTKGDKELAEFLEEEIKAETKTMKSSALQKIEGFDIKTEGGDIILTKKFNSEIVTIKLNVNHSVDAEAPQEMDMNQDKEPEFGEMKAKPDFTVQIAKEGKTLCLRCNFTSEDSAPEEPSQDDYNDVFQISEMYLYEGEMKDSNYSVSGEIMDGYLYDLLMNMLEERGISNEFSEKLTEFCTAYEHQQYIGLLKGLKSFVSGN